VKTKAKKATVSERLIVNGITGCIKPVQNMHAYRELAKAIDRLIKRERRKEREKCIAAIQFRAKAWAEFILTLHPSSANRPLAERMAQECTDIIDGIREGAKQR
jgi:hypothetical protein